MFPGDGQTASNGKDIWEIGTKWFPLARMKELFQKYISMSEK